jgi:2-polyprenyl-6-methoxyphenol hydroxylase-like FAD-dependent oxidoreductase
MSAIRSLGLNAEGQAEGSLVIGGGLSGLAAAAALRNVAGLSDVRVLESTADGAFRSNAGAAVQLGPNGLRALRLIGGDAVVSKILEAGTRLRGNIIISPPVPPKEGEEQLKERQEIVIPDATEADTGLPQVLIRWGVLRSILTELLPADSISTGLGGDIVGYQVDESTNTVAPIRRDGQAILPPERAETLVAGCPLIIAADGIHSTFRPLLQASSAVSSTLSSSLPEGAEFVARRVDLKYGGRVNVKAVVSKPLLEVRTCLSYIYYHYNYYILSVIYLSKKKLLHISPLKLLYSI